ncbi:hypothetical protein HD553DRAFT_46493 [Filobasidium floriforme]|uniref:uncharacterized protein n=1 Tax=Filobasidium floriforme TaxID=5210 RepID=UPI001E8CC3ED|nr:uncharacterized protein HD553DRAFT_46493 [Filobasidium floriforme]KAH8083531.1 hypothetical protein HD553DRAFT_46493 [Filobasidium floriforme]
MRRMTGKRRRSLRGRCDGSNPTRYTARRGTLLRRLGTQRACRSMTRPLGCRDQQFEPLVRFVFFLLLQSSFLKIEIFVLVAPLTARLVYTRYVRLLIIIRAQLLNMTLKRKAQGNPLQSKKRVRHDPLHHPHPPIQHQYGTWPLLDRSHCPIHGCPLLRL